MMLLLLLHIVVVVVVLAGLSSVGVVFKVNAADADANSANKMHGDIVPMMTATEPFMVLVTVSRF
jgi:type III secretory pathway component EscU